MKSQFAKGMYHGIPIALGYLSVSFGFGIMAIKAGITALEAVGISLTNLTSAGQVAGVTVIAAGGTFLEMALTQFIINMRYMLMAVSLTQKLDNSFNTVQRMIVSFGITDEIYAVAISQPEKLSAKYMKGLMLTPIIGWTSGTFLGAVAGQALPVEVSNALGIMLYGMFIAVIIPPCKKNMRLIPVILMAVAISTLITFAAPFISSGFAVIISALVSSIVAAIIFPVKEDA